MDLALDGDQAAILDALDALVRPFEAPALHDAPLAPVSDALDAALAEGGFLDVAADPDLGTLAAALVVERLARLPVAVEAAASALVRPLLGSVLGADPSRPLCLVEAGRTGRPIRFLRPGASVLIVGGGPADDGVALLAPAAAAVRPEASLFAYPVATLLDPAGARPLAGVAAADVRVRWRVALAAEAAGLMAAALASTVAHVGDRHQFGRPLATFQAVRHRLAEAQVRANGLRWLAFKAAASLDPGDAALAALHAQESARASVYDFHQFLGAMGMTLEHPLHTWTYRLKALASDLDGRGGQALAAAAAIWG